MGTKSTRPLTRPLRLEETEFRNVKAGETIAIVGDDQVQIFEAENAKHRWRGDIVVVRRLMEGCVESRMEVEDWTPVLKLPESLRLPDNHADKIMTMTLLLNPCSRKRLTTIIQRVEALAHRIEIDDDLLLSSGGSIHLPE